MKKRILPILAFMILICYNACTPSSTKPEKQSISVVYSQDTSKLSQSEKNQLHIIKNQEEMLHNQDILINNQENVLNNQANVLKNQDSIKDNMVDSTQQNVIRKVKSIVANTQMYTESIYTQLEKTRLALKTQQKQIDSLIVIKMK